MELQLILLLALGVIALPFYVYIIGKCAAAGWMSGTLFYLGRWQRRRHETPPADDAHHPVNVR